MLYTYSFTRWVGFSFGTAYITTKDLNISAIGGIETWKDAAEFIALGAVGLQVCTAAMLYGFRIVDDMIAGLSDWLQEKGYQTIEDFRGKAVANTIDWNNLDMNFDTKALIDQDSCIECGRCHIACEDTSHQAITFDVAENGKRTFTVIDDECVGCNLCQIVCPVPQCIEMVPVDNGLEYMNWTNNPLNPMNN